MFAYNISTALVVPHRSLELVTSRDPTLEAARML